jgi:hypothetical protein
MRPLFQRLLLVLLVVGALSACTQAAPAPSQTATEPPATTAGATAEPTQAPEATATAAPTAAPAATETTAPTTTPAPSPTPDLAANAPTGQAALDLLVQASKAQLAQAAFRATITGKDANGKDTALVIEYVKPDGFHLVTSEQEFIIVKDGTFMKAPNGKWQKSPVNVQGLISEVLNEQSIERLVKDLNYQDVKLVGADIIAGKPVWVYQYKSTSDIGGAKVATDTKTWIGIADKLPYRMESESDSGSGAKSSMVGTYEYDESIKIVAPSVSG